MWSRHGTLVANTVATVNIPAEVAQEIEVMNRDGAAAIFFTIDGSTPAVAGDNTFALPAAISSVVVPLLTRGAFAVKLKSAGTPTYSVTAD